MATITISEYLSGKVRNIPVPDTTLSSIILDAGITTVTVDGAEIVVNKDTDVTLLTEKQRELCLAWLYVWIAGSPTESGGYSEQDADWQKSENGERMSAKVLSNYLNMANAIFEKYDMAVVNMSKWGVKGHGMRQPRNYRYVKTR